MQVPESFRREEETARRIGRVHLIRADAGAARASIAPGLCRARVLSEKPCEPRPKKALKAPDGQLRRPCFYLLE